MPFLTFWCTLWIGGFCFFICWGRLLKKLVNHFVDLALGSLLPWFLASLVQSYQTPLLTCWNLLIK